MGKVSFLMEIYGNLIVFFFFSGCTLEGCPRIWAYHVLKKTLPSTDLESGDSGKMDISTRAHQQNGNMFEPCIPSGYD